MREEKEKYFNSILALFVLSGFILSIWVWCSFFGFPHMLFPVSTQQSQLPPTTAALNIVSNPLQYTASPVTTDIATPILQQENITPALTGEHLLIPSIGVDAPIETLGVQPDGALALPEINPWTGVGWYSGGVAPGEQGSAVIDGFLNAPGNKPAVFWNLRNLHANDSIDVVNADDSVVHFRVLGLGTYPLNAAAIDMIFNNSSGHFLNLITYPGAKTSAPEPGASRLVIYTSLAP